MATTLRVSLCFFCDAHLWCQVSRTLLWYFQIYRLLSILPFLAAHNMTHQYHRSNLHNRKTSIPLKRKKIIQKEKRHFSVFWKAFQISRKYFSCHMSFLSFFKESCVFRHQFQSRLLGPCFFVTKKYFTCICSEKMGLLKRVSQFYFIKISNFLI